ncbi:unnamed protein product [Owenia fusiformis]|uniref:Alkyl transferase n=1 Tax=Owenia fusiformis TaxID=6347 RepID=A0A8S4PYA9_OWEFU|nr:unnamed protein product [Owenia fusiformis]
MSSEFIKIFSSIFIRISTANIKMSVLGEKSKIDTCKMSVLGEKSKIDTWYHRLCQRVLKAGPVPRHVAFIMDGNRRFAKKQHIERAEGHVKGFDKLAETLDWCLRLGITEVTVYAFSIENFKRSKEEVEGLMELAKQKFTRLLQERELIEKHDVCVRVIGDITMLPSDVQEVVAEAVYISRNNKKAILNVCLAYTSRDEICNAMRECAEGVELGIIKDSDITERVLENCFYTNKSRKLDMLVRTSGEVRLSDFMLWQSSYSVLSFVEVLWPEFSVWHMYAGVLHYQKHHKGIADAYTDYQLDQERLQRESDLECLMQELNLTGGHTTSKPPVTNLEEQLLQYKADREKRLENFKQHVISKRENFIENIACSKKHQILGTSASTGIVNV